MKFSKLFNLLFLVVSLGLLVVACEGPEGPAGPAGKDGKDGKDGTDGTEKCSTCHNVSTSLQQKINQWEMTAHATGDSWVRGTIGSCAPCHSTEGFRLAIAGEEVTAPAVSTPLGCRGCHNVHVNFDMTDFDPVTTSEVTLKGDMTEGQVVNLGKGNLCANCHQSRTRNYGLENGGDITIVPHFGPHHGSQTNVFVGNGLYEVAGSMAYENSAHTSMISDGCVQCHMVDGSHDFKPVLSACTACHTSAEDFDVNKFQTETFDVLFAELQTLLEEEGLIEYHEDEGAYEPVTGQTVPADKAGALFNYFGLLDDGSRGVHNPKYVKAILTNSIEVFK